MEVIRKKAVGHEIKQLNTLFKKGFMKEAASFGVDEVTVMHGWIMRYLSHHRDQDVYQKNIESDFGVSRSTVTSIVQLMEKKGYIKRENVPGDARLKKLVLTQKGEETNRLVEKSIDRMEKRLEKGLTSEEIEAFYRIADKIKSNLEV